MRYHHTKNKGDLGVAKAIADMVDKGWRVLMPMSEHEAYDFVAYDGRRFVRVQAKYRAVADGTIGFTLATCWADRHGVHSVPIDRNAIDLLCVYCPDTSACYYIDPKTWDRNAVSLRVTETRNNQSKGIRWARDFVEIPSTVRGVPAGEGSGLVGWGWVRQSPIPRAA